MVDRKKLLESIRLFVLDLDGTLYLGDHLIEGSIDFLRRAHETGRHILFFTNNTSRNPQEYIAKLGRLGIPITRDYIMTAGDVTLRYLKRHDPNKRVFLLGVPSLKDSFLNAGITLSETAPDIVVAAFDKTLTYDRLTKACTFIRRGAEFIATHPDINCPTETGPVPDCGAICAAITSSTGKKPCTLGKPAPETLEAILEATGTSIDEVAFVGDRLYTDVACGTLNGAKGLLVLTGESTLADVAESSFKPNGIYQSLGEIGTMLT